jgi:hypothetical protein
MSRWPSEPAAERMWILLLTALREWRWDNDVLNRKMAELGQVVESPSPRGYS